MNNNVFGHEWGDSPITLTRVTQSRVKTIGASLHEWPNACIMLFLTCFAGSKTDKSMKIPMDRSPHARRLWYCDVPQTSIVTSFWLIAFRQFLTGSRASSRRRQVDYHSLIIESDPRRFHWLACKNMFLRYSELQRGQFSQYKAGLLQPQWISLI